LRTAEAQTLGAVVLAYEDVRRDELTLAVQNDDLEFLRSQRDEIRARQKVGDVTRTDVSQAEAQLLDTRASIAATRGQLDADRAEYAAVVGHLPGTLATEEALPGLPKTVDEAFDLVEQSNPSLNQARQTAQASKARVDEARAADRPTITLQAAFGSNGTLVPAYARNFERTIEGQAVINQPIFNGGQNASQIRQAKAEANRDRIGIEVARRSAVQSAAQAWGQMLANRNDAETRDAEVVAALATLEGERQEYRAGLRSTLEVLIAEQTLRDARIAAVAARRQAYLAEVGVLSATGRLEIRYLAPEAPLYDPAKPYGQIKDAGGLPWDGALRAIDGLVR
jgi:outer membrane protein